MKGTSKFIVFILSFLPGLSHLYVGFRDRAVIFFLMFFGAIFGVLGVSTIVGAHDLMTVLGFILPLIWFIGLVDAIGLVDKNRGLDVEGFLAPDNRKLITIALSIIPGAGHMYLGLQRQGLQFMSLFFFAAFLMGWLNMSLFLFALPVIWFYCLFDAYHRSDEPKEVKWEDDLFFISWLKERPRLVGWGLILLGAMVILERIITPLIDMPIRNFLQTGVVALILILSGIKLLAGNKLNTPKEVEKQCDSAE